MHDTNPPPGYDGPLDPHNWMKANRLPDGSWQQTAAGEKQWVCNYCGAAGSYDEMNLGGCSHRYEDCKHCGYSPACALDCSGMAAVLTSPAVYLAGWGDKQ